MMQLLVPCRLIEEEKTTIPSRVMLGRPSSLALLIWRLLLLLLLRMMKRASRLGALQAWCRGRGRYSVRQAAIRFAILAARHHRQQCCRIRRRRRIVARAQRCQSRPHRHGIEQAVRAKAIDAAHPMAAGGEFLWPTKHGGTEWPAPQRAHAPRLERGPIVVQKVLWQRMWMRVGMGILLVAGIGAVLLILLMGVMHLRQVGGR